MAKPKPKRPAPPRRGWGSGGLWRPVALGGGLPLAGAAYVGVDYLRHLSPVWHGRLRPALWAALALATAARAPFYRRWDAEVRAAPRFFATIAFMLAALLCEAISVRFVSTVLGLRWHRSTAPLPDTGQWMLLALSGKLPQTVVDLLKARIITLHHYLMLFIMLAFSALFDCIKGPGLGIGSRYMFTMAVGRLLRTITFIATILPSARPWCAHSRYQIPDHPHPWAQKYYAPYASDPNMIWRVMKEDTPYATLQDYPDEYKPDWGLMSFLVDLLRPSSGEGPSWYHLLRKSSGGCNDLIYSGHMFVAVLTAMAWAEAYGGWSSVVIWFLVIHSAQREVRERHHYSVDCIVAIYIGVLLWRMTGFLWSAMETNRSRRLAKLDEVQKRLFQAAKDSDVLEIRSLLNEVELAGQENKGFSQRIIFSFAAAVIVFTVLFVLLAFTLTNDG
ncbi:uncharacterized protein LOC8064245 [Sorghum bicolor]|uniref:Sphingomyelin synthase-like domain-containing protein n=1 Tax=Sorghum bicolor TaxID=4558 RepID=C5XU46_SORBI|nr:uncharacterized protein LOC8064245 [Sorghum bicolor]EES06936.1 hypothetical protein SORBI_3004G171100 [Sorghum bicolor]|eukprot:XP_002453960.1 uncharacterized protein LOC8064245 [Sorghum bicolor]